MRPKSIFKAIFLVISLLTFGQTSGRAAAPAQTQLPGQEITIQSTPLQVVDLEVKKKIPAPEPFRQLDPANAATPDDFIITYTGTWTPEAKTAFDYAASIWSSLIDPSVKITINAHPDTNYGAAFSLVTFEHDYPGSPKANTWYPRALANQLAGYDIGPNDFDFDFYYCQCYDWYYGTDGNTPAAYIDFVSVVLHEIGHGLGFDGSFYASNSASYPVIKGYWGLSYGYPTILDTFLVTGAGQSLLDTSLFPNPSPELGVQLLSDDTYFDGPRTRAVNQNLRAKIFTTVDPHNNSQAFGIGDHLDEDSYNGTSNALMTPTLSPGESIHDPGPLALGILADLGWTLSPNLPVFSPLPSQMVQANTQHTNVIDLWNFVSAVQSPSANFTFAISNTPDPGAGVSLHDNRYIDLVLINNWLGETEVWIKATNLQGLSATSTFKVFVVDEIHSIFLPTLVN